MKDGDFTHALCLHKRVKIPFLDLWVDQGLAEVIAILVEVDSASILIYHDS